MDGFKNTTRMKSMFSDDGPKNTSRLTEGTTARPRTAAGREAGNRDLGLPEAKSQHPDTRGMTAAEIRKAGEAIGRGNRTPYEPIPPAPGETARPVKRAMGGPAKPMKMGGSTCAPRPMKTGGAACGTKAVKTGGLAVMPKNGKKC